MENSLELVRKVRDDLYNQLKDNPSMMGVGLFNAGTSFGVKVNFLSDEALNDAALPAEIDGVPIQTAVVGPVQAQN